MRATASCLSRLGQGLRNLWTGLDEGLHGCLQGLGLTWILLKIGGAPAPRTHRMGRTTNL